MSLTGKVAADKLLRGKISKLDVIYTDTYEIAVKNGYKGTVEEWLASLKGDKGEKGDTGDKGDTGAKGDKGDPGEKGAKGDAGAQGPKGDKGDTGATGPQGPAGEKGEKGDTGPQGPQGIQGPQGDGGSGKSVKAYGAVGNGSTDDTAAFRAALAAERVVYVPGGTYKLSGGLVIGDNCMLELAQDAVLVFTQTSGNCITLGMLSNLKGNHATVKVPYAFEGNVLYAYSNDTSEADINKVPPFSKWDPQWKSGRYVTDLNICKADSRGFHYCVNPNECKGAAVYLSADHTVGKSTFMWGIYISGLRIAGAFSYGIRCANFDNAWMHEMRIDNAFIDACEIGVSLEDCNNTYISATIQPRRGYTQDKVYFPYAKHGIQLIRSRNTDLSGSRVWDWNNPDNPNTVENEKNTLYEIDNEYQHISMIGDCTGTIINDFMYHVHGDTRQRIYTDYAYNLETLTILQEPINRWFKVIDDEPYYDNGLVNKKLLSEDGLKEYFDTETVKNFTDVLPTATDKDGTIYNGIGYKIGGYLSGGGEVIDTTFCTVTGFIPLKRGQKMYVEGMSFASYADMCKVYTYDANKAPIRPISAEKLTSGTNWHMSYGETQSGFWASLNSVVDNADVAYVRFSVLRTQTSTNPMIAIDEEIKYTIVGTLADGIKVKGENIIGTPGQTNPDWVATKTETGGDNVVIPEQTISGGMWSKRQFDIYPDADYEVYINGKRYTCRAWANGKGAGLGNNSSLTLNDYPFSILWSGGTSTSGMFFSDSTITSPITLKVTDGKIVEYNKMPEGYLPDGVVMDEDISGMVKSVNGKKPDASGNVTIATGGGGGVDVTAQVGQTIMVKEVDSNGKPTKWEAAPYQPRTHWTEEVVILPETTLAVEGMAAFTEIEYMYVAGKTYKVMYNGTEYMCTAIDLGDGVVAIGNTDVLLKTGDNGMPFASLYEGALGFVVFDGSTSITVSVAEVNCTPIPVEYVTNAFPYYIDCTIEAAESGKTTGATADTVANVLAIFKSGRDIKLRATDITIGSLNFLSLSMVANVEVGTIFYFTNVILSYSGKYTNGIGLYLIPKEDGTYTVSSSLGN